MSIEDYYDGTPEALYARYEMNELLRNFELRHASEQPKKYWKMRDGTRIEWKDMDNKHVINTYNLINRQLESFVVDSIQKRIEYNFIFNAKKQLIKQIKERNL